VPLHSVVVSSVTHAELLYGVAKRGHPKGLATRVHEFLIRVEALPWDQEVARVHADLRAACEAAGVTLAPMDMMIAAHAKVVDAVLVTRDRAFGFVRELKFAFNLANMIIEMQHIYVASMTYVDHHVGNRKPNVRRHPSV
jgi:tRNA(fMet)-specific endonuclease VapC